MADIAPTEALAREADLVAAISGGDREAFAELFRGYEQRLFRYFARLLGDAPAAEELVSDVMLEVWKGAARFRGGAKVSTWIFGIAHHKAIDELRRRRPGREGLGEAARLADPRPDPQAAAVGRGLRAQLRAALAALSPAHREVLELTFYQGLALKEISAVLRCPLNTVKTRLFYARRQLAPILVAAGFGGAEP